MKYLVLCLLVLACAPKKTVTTATVVPPPAATPAPTPAPACQSQDNYNSLTAQLADLNTQLTANQATVAYYQAHVDEETAWLNNPPVNASASAVTAHQNNLAVYTNDLTAAQAVSTGLSSSISDVNNQLLIPVCS